MGSFYKTSSSEFSKQTSQQTDSSIVLQSQNYKAITRQITPEANAQPILGIRTKQFSPLSTQIPSNFNNKRDIIDLTVSDEEESFPRKKSRSSSQSTVASNELKSEHREDNRDILNSGTAEKDIEAKQSTQYRCRPFFATKSTRVRENRPKEKRPIFHSPIPSNSTNQYVSAVKLPPLQPSPAECRKLFLKNLQALEDISLVNAVDDSSPPLDFKFIKKSVLGKGVKQATEEFMFGCTCRKDNGRSIGCEYLSCECLADSAVTAEGRRVFPYAAGRDTFRCLRDFYLNGGYHIFECNERCNCESNCKNRVIQHGRSVPLEIFKTINRGWGLRCKIDLKKGQFIDTYRGEIITSEEADLRGKGRDAGQDNYFFGLDRWEEENEGYRYVVDGMYMGGPTRFINHSCDPNCRQFTASYNHADVHIYDLAFFTTEPIPAMTELTFDYGESVDEDRDEGDGDDENTIERSRVVTEKEAKEMERVKGYPPTRCLCGAGNCRGYFFT